MPNEEMKGEVYLLRKFKVRKEDSVFIIKFQGLSEYFAINETGKDILCYLEEHAGSVDDLYRYLEDQYGQLDDSQMGEINDFLEELKLYSI